MVAHCTCMAGLAETCSNVGAVLHWVETDVRVRNATPCTSKENKWLMPTPVKDIPYVELRDIDFTTPNAVLTTSSSTNTLTNDRVKIASPSSTDKAEAGIFPQNCTREREEAHYPFCS